MLADLDQIFSQHDVTIRRAEANYALNEARRAGKPAPPMEQPIHRISQALRRLVGSPAYA